MLSAQTAQVSAIHFLQVKRIHRVSYQEYKQQCQNAITQSRIAKDITLLYFQAFEQTILITE